MSAIGTPGSAGRPSSPSVMLKTPRQRLDGEIVRGPVAVRPRVAERVHGAVDDARVALAHGRVADAEPLADTGPKRLDEHVGRRGEREQPLDVARVFQVEHDAFLAAVQVAEVDGRRAVGGADAPRRVAVGRLDLDDLGAVIGERQRQIRARQEHREVDDA